MNQVKFSSSVIFKSLQGAYEVCSYCNTVDFIVNLLCTGDIFREVIFFDFCELTKILNIKQNLLKLPYHCPKIAKYGRSTHPTPPFTYNFYKNYQQDTTVIFDIHLWVYIQCLLLNSQPLIRKGPMRLLKQRDFLEISYVIARSVFGVLKNS